MPELIVAVIILGAIALCKMYFAHQERMKDKEIKNARPKTR